MLRKEIIYTTDVRYRTQYLLLLLLNRSMGFLTAFQPARADDYRRNRIEQSEESRF
jgi:hypothetical protein